MIRAVLVSVISFVTLKPIVAFVFFVLCVLFVWLGEGGSPEEMITTMLKPTVRSTRGTKHTRCHYSVRYVRFYHSVQRGQIWPFHPQLVRSGKLVHYSRCIRSIRYPRYIRPFVPLVYFIILVF